MTHLSHKIPWHLLVDYFTPYKDPGISFPVGVCDKIHVNSRKVELQVKNRKYITENDICTDDTCVTRSEKKIFRKNTKKKKIFEIGQSDDKKRVKFFQTFEKVVMEFANTELNTPIKEIKYDSEFNYSTDYNHALTYCEECNVFITLLEFGDKKELFKYTDEEIRGIFDCLHGGQAVGNNMHFLLDHILSFYLLMNVILNCNLKQEDWPAKMKPGSFFRNSLLHACDGQTFLPHSRKYLTDAMVDLEKSKTLSKNLFRFIYFFVMMRLKIDKNYSLAENMYFDYWFTF